MKINATIDIEDDEMLDILTTAIEGRFRYSNPLPTGEATSIHIRADGGWRVIWGQRPVPVEPTPETSVAIECKPSCCSQPVS